MRAEILRPDPDNEYHASERYVILSGEGRVELEGMTPVCRLDIDRGQDPAGYADNAASWSAWYSSTSGCTTWLRLPSRISPSL